MYIVLTKNSLPLFWNHQIMIFQTKKIRKIRLRTEAYLELCQKFMVELFSGNCSSIEFGISEPRDQHILTFWYFLIFQNSKTSKNISQATSSKQFPKIFYLFKLQNKHKNVPIPPYQSLELLSHFDLVLIIELFLFLKNQNNQASINYYKKTVNSNAT